MIGGSDGKADDGDGRATAHGQQEQTDRQQHQPIEQGADQALPEGRLDEAEWANLRLGARATPQTATKGSLRPS